MDDILRARVENNLFPAARAAVEPWDHFPWPPNGKAPDTWQTNSSQALAIDFFGTLKMVPAAERGAVLGRLAASLRLPDSGPWKVELEWVNPCDRLNEPRQSQVDAIAMGAHTRILFECEFRERDGGTCSQTTPQPVGSKAKLPQCDGRYEMQKNPVNGKTARCALTGKGIRYWDFIPNVFQMSSTADPMPCPFDGPWYQWMRNLVLADAIRRSEARQTSVVIVYADHPNLPFANKLKSSKWTEFVRALRTDEVQLHPISYQELLRVAVDAVGSKNAMWGKLENWVMRKIDCVGKAAMKGNNVERGTCA